MNMEEYRKRIDNAHTVTGVPSYWEELQQMKTERDMWRVVAEQLALGAEDFLNDGLTYQLKKGLDIFNEAIK